MQTEIKDSIIDAATLWCSNNNLTQADLSKKSGVNQSYLSNMMRKIYFTSTGGQEVVIADKWFHKLADAIGYAIAKQYWSVVQTRELEQIIHYLNDAKKHPAMITIIVDTGMGKTYTVDRFCNVNPQHTYKVTVNSMYAARNILGDLAEQVGVGVRYYSIDTLADISKRLKQIRMSGHKPMIIIDEAENLKLPVIQMMKGLYDMLNGYVSIVLIGTTQLTDSIARLKRSNKTGAPQFHRRIKAGIKRISVSNDFKPFYERFKITDKGLQKLLNSLASNYGELHDYLEPVLRYCDENEQPISEALFRTFHNIPNL